MNGLLEVGADHLLNVAESIRAISLCMRVRSGVNGSDSGARDVWWSYLGLGLGSVRFGSRVSLK